MKQFLEIGKIVSVHGIQGEVKVMPWCDSPEDFKKAKNFYFDNGEKEISITCVKIVKNMVILKIEGINTREDAIKLRNKIVYVNRSSINLPQNTYFVQDLVGLEVVDADSNMLYGTISDVSQTGANDVYHIKSSENKMYYIPAIKQVIIKTDIENGKMYIRPMKGLFDDEN